MGTKGGTPGLGEKELLWRLPLPAVERRRVLACIGARRLFQGGNVG